MTAGLLANCERLRKILENREAIYLELGVLRVRVTNIRASAEHQAISADLEEIPTVGLRSVISSENLGATKEGPLRWTISTGHRTVLSDHTWSVSDRGWCLFFGSELVQGVVRLADEFPSDLSGYERYHWIRDWLRSQTSTQGPQAQPLLRADGSGPVGSDIATSHSNLPALVADGILFENTGSLLRWGTPLSELSETGSPTITWRPEMALLTWSTQTCLDGLACDVRTGRSFGLPDLDSYHHYLGEFHWVSLEVRGLDTSTPDAMERSFRGLYKHLERVLGSATFSYPRCEGPLPSIHWKLAGMDIGCSISRGEPSIYISHEPGGYPALKAAAKAARARWVRGRRVDYVAWPESDR